MPILLDCMKGFLGALLSGVAGILLFLLVLLIMNLTAPFIESPVIISIVDFLNSNAVFLIILGIVFMFGDMLRSLVFPFNLPYPVLYTIASVMLAEFVIRALALADRYTGLGIGEYLSQFSYLLFGLVAIVVLISGYVSIISRVVAPRRQHYHQ